MSRSDEDYVRLDEAILAIRDWEEEISDRLRSQGRNPRILQHVLKAMSEVHSPDEDEPHA
jgi:hypothetical protein